MSIKFEQKAEFLSCCMNINERTRRVLREIFPMLVSVLKDNKIIRETHVIFHVFLHWAIEKYLQLATCSCCFNKKRKSSDSHFLRSCVGSRFSRHTMVNRKTFIWQEQNRDRTGIEKESNRNRTSHTKRQSCSFVCYWCNT